MPYWHTYLSQVWRVRIKWDNDMKRENIGKTIRRHIVNEEGKEIRQRALDLKK